MSEKLDDSLQKKRNGLHNIVLVMLSSSLNEQNGTFFPPRWVILMLCKCKIAVYEETGGGWELHEFLHMIKTTVTREGLGERKGF